MNIRTVYFIKQSIFQLNTSTYKPVTSFSLMIISLEIEFVSLWHIALTLRFYIRCTYLIMWTVTRRTDLIDTLGSSHNSHFFHLVTHKAHRVRTQHNILLVNTGTNEWFILQTLQSNLGLRTENIILNSS